MTLCSLRIAPARVHLPRRLVSPISLLRTMPEPSFAVASKAIMHTETEEGPADQRTVVQSRGPQLCTSGLSSACCILLHQTPTATLRLLRCFQIFESMAAYAIVTRARLIASLCDGVTASLGELRP